MSLFQLLQVSRFCSVCNCYTFLLCETEANWEKCGETYLICSLFTLTCCGGFHLEQHSGWSTYEDWKVEADTWKNKDTQTKCILPFCPEWIINVQTLKCGFICVLHSKEFMKVIVFNFVQNCWRLWLYTRRNASEWNAAPQTTAPQMIIQLYQYLSETVSAES